jgi:hypothetical protein
MLTRASDIGDTIHCLHAAYGHRTSRDAPIRLDNGCFRRDRSAPLAAPPLPGIVASAPDPSTNCDKADSAVVNGSGCRLASSPQSGRTTPETNATHPPSRQRNASASTSPTRPPRLRQPTVAGSAYVRRTANTNKTKVVA